MCRDAKGNGFWVGDGSPLQGALEGAQLCQERGLESLRICGIWALNHTEGARAVLAGPQYLLGLLNFKQEVYSNPSYYLSVCCCCCSFVVCLFVLLC